MQHSSSDALIAKIAARNDMRAVIAELTRMPPEPPRMPHYLPPSIQATLMPSAGDENGSTVLLIPTVPTRMPQSILIPVH